MDYVDALGEVTERFGTPAGRLEFLSDPGGQLDYLGLDVSPDTATAVIDYVTALARIDELEERLRTQTV